MTSPPCGLSSWAPAENAHERAGTPTLMLADGTRLRPPIAFPVMRERKVVAVGKLPCCGVDCLDATRALVEQALQSRR